MEYRFSLTPRLIALAIFSGIALLILLFTLGFMIGQRMTAPVPATTSVGAYGDAAKERAAALNQQAKGKAAEMSATIAPPADASGALPKAAP